MWISILLIYLGYHKKREKSDCKMGIAMLPRIFFVKKQNDSKRLQPIKNVFFRINKAFRDSLSIQGVCAKQPLLLQFNLRLSLSH